MDEGSSFSVRLFNPTGGLIYHLRARRYRNSLWLPFRQQLSGFLDDWQPSERELLILGPSGGYTLPTDFLERFKKIYLFDPDRLAPMFFAKNHPGLNVEWSRENLIFDGKQFSAKKLGSWLREKKVAVLFSNILGQLPLLGDVEGMQAWWHDLQPALATHSWLTYHDLFSFEQHAKLPATLPEGPVVPQLVEWALKHQKPLELIDHGTQELFPSSNVNWTWNFSVKRTHIVGGAHSGI
jgi:hypothetical protein